MAFYAFVLLSMNSFVGDSCDVIIVHVGADLVVHVGGDDGEGGVGRLPDGVGEPGDAVGGLAVVTGALHTVLKYLKEIY